MRRHRFCAAFVAMIGLMLLPVLSEPSFAQRRGASALSGRPAPRFPDGRVNLGSPPGEKGLWVAVDNRLVIPELPEDIGDRDVQRDPGAGVPPELGFPKLKVSEVPFQPWARALFTYRQHHEFEPYTRCKPAGGLRMVATAYGTDFIDVPEQKRIYITQIGGPHSFRPIYMDGRPHPKDLDPSYYGHSVGYWEGDKLVVDTIGYNERGWIDLRGIPTTEQLHTTERFSRPDFNILHYEITIDDPGAYTGPWTSGIYFQWDPGAEQFEFLCQDGNLAPLLMIGTENQPLDRTSEIVP